MAVPEKLNPLARSLQLLLALKYRDSQLLVDSNVSMISHRSICGKTHYPPFPLASDVN